MGKAQGRHDHRNRRLRLGQATYRGQGAVPTLSIGVAESVRDAGQAVNLVAGEPRDLGRRRDGRFRRKVGGEDRENTLYLGSGRRIGTGAARNEQHELTLERDIVSELAREFGQRARRDLLVEFREFARNRG